jgi:hypothetical protein
MRLRARFAEHGLSVLVTEEDNAVPLRAAGAAGLLRLFESFLRNAAHAGTTAPEPPAPSLRFRHRPTLWRKIPRLRQRFGGGAEAAREGDEGAVAEAQLTKLHQFRNNEFKFLLERIADIGERFVQARASHLIVRAESAHGVEELSSDGAMMELSAMQLESVRRLRLLEQQ